ncbi:MAG: hypothetical protein HYV97_07395 [Bdellovibrio sp.]|nr:hypothetical protein [Bdellovibrio sp.]
MKIENLFILILSLLILPTSFGQIYTDCNTFTYADVDEMCGWVSNGGATDARNSSNRGRRSTQAEWNSCTTTLRNSLHCPDNILTFRPGSGPDGRLSPANIVEIKAQECATQLASFADRISEYGEYGPTHAQWKTCLKSKGLHGILNEYKNLQFFKTYNAKNKIVRAKFCKDIKKKYRLSAAARAERVRLNTGTEAKDLQFCKELVATGIRIMSDDDEYSYHYPFGQYAKEHLCAFDRGERLELCAHMFENWNPTSSEQTALTSQCNRFTEWEIASGENVSIGCSKTVRIGGKTWQEFATSIREKQKIACDKKLNQAIYALIMTEFEALALNSVMIDLSNPEGIWQGLNYDSVEERFYPQVKSKLSSIKSKIKEWLRSHSTFEGCKAYDSLNILAIIKRDSFSDFVATHRSRPIRVGDHNRGTGTRDDASAPEVDSSDVSTAPR